MKTTPNFIELDEATLRWAKALCERKFRCVPLWGLKDGHCTCPKGQACRSAGKHPVERAWQRKATSSYDELKLQLAGRNLGVATGDGLVALDVDGDEGQESLRQLVERHGPLPEGPVAETGSGGMHFWFRAHGVPNRVKFLPGLDARGDGGQVVVPPSLHRSGRRYAWLASPDDVGVPECPPWLLALMRGDERVEWDAGAWLRQQNPAIEGENGSAQLMRVTGALTRNGVRTLERYLEAIEEWNERCQPPWSEKELSHAFDSAMREVKERAVVQLPLDKNGNVICSRSQLDRILSEDPRYEGAFTRDARTLHVYYNGKPMTDDDHHDIDVEICGRYRLRQINPAWLRGSISRWARKKEFNPVTDYLNGLKWDGEKRLMRAPAEIFSSGEDPFYGTIFKRWAIGAARRALQPGCKMDNVLVLQGPQDLKKSFFFDVMGGPWYSSTELRLDNKDVYQQIHGAWIIEWAELASLARAESERVKAFLSTRCDDYRLPYDRTMLLAKPRPSVIVGTTNADAFLRDPTGNRRFWVVPVRKVIDVDRVREWRDQLWAEAVALAKVGERHWLDGEESAQRVARAEQYEVGDSVFDAACDRLERLLPAERQEPGHKGEREQRIARVELERQLGVRENHPAVLRALKQLGFERVRRAIEQSKPLARVYARPAT
jgi:predicted P-loop ATPase